MRWEEAATSHPMGLETKNSGTMRRSPIEPEASNDNSTVGQWGGAGRNDMPFHLLANVFHQARSERKPELRRMGMLL